MSTIWQDVRYAVRSLRRSPVFLAAVMLTLGLGIGANTAVFTLVDAVLLHPLAVERPNELVAIFQDVTDQRPRLPLTFPFLQTLQQRSRSFRELAAYRTLNTVMRSDAASEQILLGAVSGNYFSLLGVHAAAGRMFTPADDDVVGAHAVVVLSDAFWASHFNRGRGAVGATLTLGGRPFTIIGVAPPQFHGTELGNNVQFWVPVTMAAHVGAPAPFSPAFLPQLFTGTGFRTFSVVARLRAGVTPATAASELNDIYAQEESAHPTAASFTRMFPGTPVARPMSAVPIVEAAALNDRASLVRFITILFAVVGLTLLTACVNVANLLLVRGEGRLGELSVRASLGASRARIARQLLVESALLAVAGAATGYLLEGGILGVLSRFILPGGVSLATMDLSAGPRTLGFTTLLAVVTSLIIGLVPTLKASQPDLITVLRAHGAAGRKSVGPWLLAIQVAMSLVLLVGAGLFIRSMQAGLAANIGFDPQPLAAIEADPRAVGYSAADARTYFAEALRRAQAIPGVTGAAAATHVPLSPLNSLAFVGSADDVAARLVLASTTFFDVLHVPIKEGRAFTDADANTTGATAAIPNEAAARMLFPEGNPIGKTITHAGSFKWTVVGVAQDTKYSSITDAGVPVIYAEFSQGLGFGGGPAQVVIRSSNPRAALLTLRQELATLAPRPPLQHARLVVSQIDDALAPQRFGATLLGLFSLISLTIAAVGVYGVIEYSVSRQHAEIGIRVALGAPSSHVLRAVVARNAAAVGVGIVAGLVGAALTSRALSGFLYSIRPLDPVAFGVAITAMLGAAAVASIVPVRRALRVDPVRALRL